jgi:hypothetical protein
MPKFIVRQSCEYSILIEAESASAAFREAENIDLSKWGASWSGFEAESEAGDETQEDE